MLQQQTAVGGTKKPAASSSSAGAKQAAVAADAAFPPPGRTAVGSGVLPPGVLSPTSKRGAVESEAAAAGTGAWTEVEVTIPPALLPCVRERIDEAIDDLNHQEASDLICLPEEDVVRLKGPVDAVKSARQIIARILDGASTGGGSGGAAPPPSLSRGPRPLASKTSDRLPLLTGLPPPSGVSHRSRKPAAAAVGPPPKAWGPGAVPAWLSAARASPQPAPVAGAKGLPHPAPASAAKGLPRAAAAAAGARAANGGEASRSQAFNGAPAITAAASAGTATYEEEEGEYEEEEGEYEEEEGEYEEEEGGAGSEGLMEINIPREYVGKIIGAKGAVINALREESGANIRLDKEESGAATLTVHGDEAKLDHVASLVKMILTADRSDPDLAAMMSGEPRAPVDGDRGDSGDRGDEERPSGDRDEEEYMLLLNPEEARALESSRQVNTAVKLAGVRVAIKRTGDGWVRLTLRGAHAAIEEAKSRIEAIVTPTEERDAAATKLAAGGAYGGGVGSSGDGGGSSALPTDGSGSGAAGSVDGSASFSEMGVTSRTLPNGEVRVEVELTNKDQVGAVIGESGKTINTIRRDAGVSIVVEAPENGVAGSTQRRVVIIGPADHCAEAMSMVRDVLRSNTGKRDYSQRIDEAAREGGGMVRLAVERHLVGRIIGKRGTTIKELRERSGATIEVAKDDNGVGTVTISGAAAAVRAARDEISELTREDVPIEVQHTLSRMLDEMIVINVPASRVGKLIGARGAVIQGLRQQTGAIIDLQKDANGSATCMLKGSMEVMLAARAKIEAIIEGPA